MKAAAGRWLWRSAAAAGVAATLFFALARPPPPLRPVPEAAPAAVEVVTLRARRHDVPVEVHGSVRPKRSVELAAQVGGKVSWVSDDFVDGGFASAGQALLRLEPDDYEIAVVRADAAVADAERALAVARGDARRARREWTDLGDAEANALFLRRPQTRSAEAALAAALADRRQAELNLRRTEIRAPFDARVQTVRADLGQYLAPGSPVARVYATAVAEVRLPLTDRDASLLELPFGGARESAALAATIGAVVQRRAWTWPARIVRTEAGLDTQSRVLYVVAEVSEPYRSDGNGRPPLMIGQFVSARIAGRTADAVLALPRSALRTGDVIWHADEDNRLRIAPVEFVYGTDAHALVRLAPATDAPLDVVVSALALAVEGMRLAPLAIELGDGAPGALEPLAGSEAPLPADERAL